jgi:hypothetical protein
MTPLNGPTGDHLPPVLGRFFQHDEAAASIVLIYESVMENTGCEPVDMSHQCTARPSTLTRRKYMDLGHNGQKLVYQPSTPVPSTSELALLSGRGLLNNPV